MKKQFLLLVILLLNGMLLNSQVINSLNKKSYNLSRTIFFPSINKGTSFLEINKKQRNGLPPTPSLVIYNTTSRSFEYFNGAKWVPINPYQLNPPIVSTSVATSITPTKAISGGTIKSDDGIIITARGVCWSIHANPTIVDSITSDGHGIGNFSSHINRLLANTTYFARAYATVNKGINYGNEISFKTPPFKLLCAYGDDSVTLKLEDYRDTGGVEWQASTDTIHWTTIDGVANDTYQFIPDKTQYYRALTASRPTAPVVVNQGALLKYVTIPKNMTTGNISVFQDFESTDGWSITEGNGTLETDAGHCLQCKNSIKILTGTGTSTAMQKDGPLDLSSFQVVRLWYYVPEIAPATAVVIQLSQSNFAKSVYFQSVPYKTGWNSFEVPRAGFQNINGADWNEPFDKIKVTVRQKGPDISWASIDRLEGITAATQPAVCINFDDGYESIFTKAFPIMQERKIRATSYIVTSWVGQEGMVTWDECRMLNSAGWDLGSHSHTHPDLTTLSGAQIDKELTTCRDLLIAHDLPRAAGFVAYPYGTNNELVQARMEANNMILGRAVISHYLTSPPNFKYTIEARNIARTTTLADAKRYIDNAIAGGQIISLLFHNLAENPVEDIDWSVDDFKELMDYIVLKQIQPLTITQYNELITNEAYAYKLLESK